MDRERERTESIKERRVGKTERIIRLMIGRSKKQVE